MTRIDAWDVQSPSAVQSLSCDLLISNLEEKYEVIGKELGKGGFGSVFLVKNAAGEELACKRISKRLVGANPQSQVRHISNIKREVAVMRRLGGTLNIIHLHDAFEDEEYAYLVMEHCSGGELFQNLGQRHYSEGTCKSYMRAVLRTIAQCHNLNIIHRDIKPSNFILLTPDEDSPIKAIDFGLAIFFEPSDLPIGNLGLEGTPWFMAPELLNSKAGPSIDVFAAGVMCFQLLTGTMPFNDWKNPKNAALSQVWKSILTDEPKTAGSPWADISEEAKDFVGCLLVKDPSKRLTAKEALQHSWLREGKKTQRKEGRPLGRSVVQRLQRFAAGNAFKKTVLELMTNELITRHEEQMSSEASREESASLASKVNRVSPHMRSTHSCNTISHSTTGEGSLSRDLSRGEGSLKGSLFGRRALNDRRLVARDLLLSKSVHGGNVFKPPSETSAPMPMPQMKAQPMEPSDLRSLAEKVAAVSSPSPQSSSSQGPSISYKGNPSLASPGKGDGENLLSYSFILGATQGVKQAVSSIGQDLANQQHGGLSRVSSRNRASSLLSMLDLVAEKKHDHNKVRRLILDTSTRGGTAALSSLITASLGGPDQPSPQASPHRLVNPSLAFPSEHVAVDDAIKVDGPGSTPQGMLDALEFLLPEATVHELREILAQDGDGSQDLCGSRHSLSFERVSAALLILGYNLGPGEVELLLREINSGPRGEDQVGDDREVSKTRFIASQVDWREVQANHHDEWLSSLRRTFDEMDQDKDGVLNFDELTSIIASRLPSEEAVNEAVNELLLDVACSDGVNFNEFLRMMKEDSHGSLGSSLDLYDARHEGSRHGVRLEAIESDDEEDVKDEDDEDAPFKFVD